jgi:hypothetical protein
MANAPTQNVRLRAGKKRKRSRASSADPVVSQVRNWIAARDAQDALKRKWQDAEHCLSIRIGPLRMTLMEAASGDLPEARTMRGLMRRIKAADRKLDSAARQIVRMQPASASGALAKIEMALRILAWMDSREHAYALLHGGVERLRKLLLTSRRRPASASKL